MFFLCVGFVEIFSYRILRIIDNFSIRLIIE